MSTPGSTSPAGRPGIIRGRDLRAAALALVALVLLAAAVNAPVAVSLMPARRTPVRNISNVIGPEASVHDWAAPTPHALEWPVPHQHQVDSAWMGHRRITVWARLDGHDRTTHQMQADQSGWPLPALREVQMWWPRDDPAWETDAQSDPGLKPAWAGIVLNPILIGGGMWIVLVALPMAAVAARRARRARRGLCMDCAYPVGASDVCTECGSQVRAGAPATHRAPPLSRRESGSPVGARQVRPALALLVLLVLVVAAVNVPLAVMLTTARQTPLRSGSPLDGIEAAARGWPVATPHDQPWPQPTHWWANSAWTGHRQVHARATSGQESTHSMEVNESGLPLPALRDAQVWWPWDDPAWATTAESDPGLALAWEGLLLNPLLVGGGIWLLLVALPMTAVALDRAARRRAAARGGWCAHCGAPAEPSPASEPDGEGST